MIGVSRCLFSLVIISIYSSHGYLNKVARNLHRSSIFAFDELRSPDSQEETFDNQPPKNVAPKRKDTCKMFISGIIGTEPKEAYLSNNHYVINFALAVSGHYDYIHDWEKAKPQETMWVNVEVWDSAAKDNLKQFRKGSYLNGLGTLIFNKWIDKASGEERKQFKYRLLKIMTADEMMPFSDLDTLTISSGDTLAVKLVDDEPSQQQPELSSSSIKSQVMEPQVSAIKVASVSVESVEPVTSNANVIIEERKAPTSSPPPQEPVRVYQPVKQITQQRPQQSSRIVYGSYDPEEP